MSTPSLFSFLLGRPFANRVTGLFRRNLGHRCVNVGLSDFTKSQEEFILARGNKVLHRLYMAKWEDGRDVVPTAGDAFQRHLEDKYEKKR